MTLRVRLLIVALSVLSIIGLAGWASAQFLRFEPLPEPMVLTGGDVGFRVEGRVGATPAGRLVIKVNGQWIEPEDAPMQRPAPAR